jgi:hypothetical protein
MRHIWRKNPVRILSAAVSCGFGLCNTGAPVFFFRPAGMVSVYSRFVHVSYMYSCRCVDPQFILLNSCNFLTLRLHITNCRHAARNACMHIYSYRSKTNVDMNYSVRLLIHIVYTTAAQQQPQNTLWLEQMTTPSFWPYVR